MPATIFTIEDGYLGFAAADPTGGYTDACDAAVADFADFNFSGACAAQVTSGALTASQNISTDTVPATFCDAAIELPNVGQTSYQLELSFLQDPNVVAGLSRYAFENDTNILWFFFGMDGGLAADAPKAIGQLRMVAGTIGGDPRVNLTASVTLPVIGKPQVCFGPDAASGVAV